jgi:sigma-B regulation protein RsbU (phosphoserine phosphatase)
VQGAEKRLSEKLTAMEQRIAHLERIIEISHTLNTIFDLSSLLELIVQAATELTQTMGCGVLLLDQETGDLQFRVATGPNKDGLVGRSVPVDNSIAGWILRQNKPLLVRDPQQDPRFFRGMDEATDFETRSIIGVPLQVKGQTIGVLEAVNKMEDQEMTWADVEVLNVLADQAAVAIENARLYTDLRRVKEFNEGLVQSIADGIIVTNAPGYITFVNPALVAMLGYAAEELVGQHWKAIIPPDQHVIVEAASERRQRGETDRYRLELVGKDGRRTPVLVSGTPRIDIEDGRFAGSIAVFTDITQALAHEKVEQELVLASQIQASFLPDRVPDVPGWELAATLEPARQTSGDFYDLIPLPNERLGVLVADVAGKGMGAALYMAVSRTLLRTYAVEFHTEPELMFRAANLRILRDSHADLFVTAFYGVLDPATGVLTYCNAGHNPPYILRAVNGDATLALSRTGLPLGIFEELTWNQRTAQLAPGDLLILYTDGITDAEDENGRFFGSEKLLEVARKCRERSAQAVQNTLMAEVREFMGGTPQGDDIALIAIVRCL